MPFEPQDEWVKEVYDALPLEDSAIQSDYLVDNVNDELEEKVYFYDNIDETRSEDVLKLNLNNVKILREYNETTSIVANGSHTIDSDVKNDGIPFKKVIFNVLHIFKCLLRIILCNNLN